ncbi:MAG: serine hydrolase, partial [Cyclobacteriaceae bacterium]|nr:serine hydrolase [Cyclobacteriaceae bacterium]
MKIRVLILILFAVSNWVTAQTGYFPPKGTAWEHKEPSSFKVNNNKLRDVVDFAMENEYSEPRDLR